MSKEKVIHLRFDIYENYPSCGVSETEDVTNVIKDVNCNRCKKTKFYINNKDKIVADYGW